MTRKQFLYIYVIGLSAAATLLATLLVGWSTFHFLLIVLFMGGFLIIVLIAYKNIRIVRETFDEDLFPPTPPPEVEEPPLFGIDPTARFEHQWLTGKQGTGKTTLLSTFIAHDIDEVAQGKCSIMVMDSQNQLIPTLARMRSIQHRLVYIDAAHPPAVNILEHAEGAEDMVAFFLRSGLKADTSGLMDIVLNYLVPAVSAVPNATINTMNDLLSKGGYQKYQQHFSGLDPEVQTWLAERLTDQGGMKVTFDAVKARLEGFAATATFRQMFRSPTSKLDLYKELREPKVVLVDTSGVAQNPQVLEAFGRFFIAQLFQATTRRVQDKEKLPVYFYIDEAAEYIKEEERIVDLINKARKQRVGLIMAQQDEADIRSSTVLAAVRRMAIQCRTIRPGLASFTIRGAPETVLHINETHFTDLMNEREWEERKREMRERYAPDPVTPVPLVVPPTKKKRGQEW